MLVTGVTAVIGIGTVLSLYSSRQTTFRSHLERFGGTLLVAGLMSLGAALQLFR